MVAAQGESHFDGFWLQMDNKCLRKILGKDMEWYADAEVDSIKTYRTVWCKQGSLQNVKVNRPLAHASQII